MFINNQYYHYYLCICGVFIVLFRYYNLCGLLYSIGKLNSTLHSASDLKSVASITCMQNVQT